MEVSSTTQSPPVDKESVGLNVLKKAEEVQERDVLKVLESANQQSQQVTAQKTGIGNNINLTG